MDSSASLRNERLIVLFTRRPVRGKVKTRLAAEVGDDQALVVHAALLAASWQACLGADSIADIAWDSAGCTEGFPEGHVQVGHTLGERMLSEFIRAEALGFRYTVLMGSDCPAISSGLLDLAFSLLQRHDVVLGPAHDGGYYLIGMQRPQAALMADIPWSTPHVWPDTVERCRSERLSFATLPPASDIDTAADLSRWETFREIIQ